MNRKLEKIIIYINLANAVMVLLERVYAKVQAYNELRKRKNYNFGFGQKK